MTKDSTLALGILQCTLGGPIEECEPEWISGFELARDADLLIHDCQYTDAEYPDHVGWGHSRLADTLAFARRVAARKLMLFHHDPMHTDDMLDAFAGVASERWGQLGGDGARLELATERREVEVRAEPVADPRPVT